jgi:hypothetical protein
MLSPMLRPSTADVVDNVEDNIAVADVEAVIASGSSRRWWRGGH